MQTATKIETTEFAEFYRLNFHRIAGQLHAYLGDHAEAQDLTQEAFCRALDRWTEVSGYEHAAGWVRHVAWNLATSRLRHIQVSLRHLSRQREEHVDGPSPDRIALIRALASLPSNHRLAVVQHHLGQLSTAEIAKDRGVAESTVRSWLSRGRAQLATHLTDEPGPRLRALADTGFQPAGAPAVAAAVARRRTTRRALLAAVVLAVLVLPLLVLLNGRNDGAPPVQPPSPSPTVPVPVTVRTVSLAGMTLTGSPDLSFASGQAIWLSHRAGDGSLVFGVSGDGGLTWRPVTAPEIPDSASWSLRAFSADRAMLMVGEPGAQQFLLTDDGGATFTPHPVTSLPEWARQMEGGLHRMVCPGGTGLEPPSPCDNPELIEIGVGRVTPQPPVSPGPAVALGGADGRLWILGAQQLLVSTDDASTWQEVPLPAQSPAGPFMPALSPNGGELWLHRGNTLVHRVGDEWREALAPNVIDSAGGFESWSPIGDGMAVVSYGGQVAFVADGALHPVPGIEANESMLWTMGDGTILLRQNVDGGQQTLLGIGAGTQREWIRFTY